MATLRDFMSLRRNGPAFTHIGLGGGMTRSFYIMQEDMEQFLDLFKAALKADLDWIWLKHTQTSLQSF
jgi:hypothetical protein